MDLERQPASEVTQECTIHLFRCAVFVNFSWRSNLFRRDDLPFLTSHPPHGWKKIIVDHASDHAAIGPATVDFLSNAAEVVDGYIEYLRMNTKSAMDVGLFGNTMRNLGYSLQGPHRTRFWQVFLLCVITDRIFWAFGLCGSSFSQYRHPATIFPTRFYRPKNHDKAMKRVQTTLGVIGIKDECTMDAPHNVDDTAVFTGLLATTGVSYTAKGIWNLVQANFLWAGAMSFFLAKPDPGQFLQEVSKAIVSPKIDPKVLTVSTDLFCSQDFRPWHRFYRIWLDSTTWLMDPQLLMSASDPKERVDFWLLESSRGVGDIPRALWEAEKSIVRSLCNRWDDLRLNHGQKEMGSIGFDEKGHLGSVIQTLEKSRSLSGVMNMQELVWSDEAAKKMRKVNLKDPGRNLKLKAIAAPTPSIFTAMFENQGEMARDDPPPTFDLELGFRKAPSPPRSLQSASEKHTTDMLASGIDQPDHEEESSDLNQVPIRNLRKRSGTVQYKESQVPPNAKKPKVVKPQGREILNDSAEVVTAEWTPLSTDPNSGLFTLPELGHCHPVKEGVEIRRLEVFGHNQERDRFRINLQLEWPNSSYDSSILEKIIDGMTHGDANWITSISEDIFYQLETKEQRRLFKHSNLHLFKEGRDPTKPFESPRNCQDSRSALEFLGVDLTKKRTIYENQEQSEMSTGDDNPNLVFQRQGTILDILKLEGSKRLDCNVLDIPLPVPFIPLPESLRSLSENTVILQEHVPRFPWAGNLYWGLFATEPAKSDPHVDSGGTCTWVEIITGAKLWCILKSNASNDTGDIDEVKEEEWGAVLLLPGDKLVMQPNSVHKVFTLRECVAAGGHFYSLDQLDRTLLGRLREHCWGLSTVNSNFPDSQAMLIALARWLQRRLKDEPELMGVDDDNFSALLCMLLHPEQFTPPFRPNSQVDVDDNGDFIYSYEEPTEETLCLWEIGKKTARILISLRPAVHEKVIEWENRCKIMS